MEILNKREKKLYKELKAKAIDEGTVTIASEELPKWTTLLDKLESSGYFTIIYADDAAFLCKSLNFEQFEIEQKEARKEERKNTTHDYKVAIISVVLSALVALLSKNVFTFFITDSIDKYNEYCYEINRAIKDIDFEKGDISDRKLILYNDGKEVYNQSYENFDSKYKIIYIRKDGNKVFFVLNASVDDEDGIVYLNGENGNIMNGLWSLERLGGDSYNYKTYK